MQIVKKEEEKEREKAKEKDKEIENLKATIQSLRIRARCKRVSNAYNVIDRAVIHIRRVKHE